MDEDQSERSDEPQTEAAGGPCAVVHYQIVEPTLFVTDTEIIHRLGAPRKAARAALHMFDHDRSKGFSSEANSMGE